MIVDTFQAGVETVIGDMNVHSDAFKGKGRGNIKTRNRKGVWDNGSGTGKGLLKLYKVSVKIL